MPPVAMATRRVRTRTIWVVDEFADPAPDLDPRNPCPKCGAWPLAPPDGLGRNCLECGWSWMIGLDGGHYSERMIATPAGWHRFARALIASMREVLTEVDDDQAAVVLETAEYWFRVGLASALEHPDESRRLLDVIEPAGVERDELLQDASTFVSEALG